VRKGSLLLPVHACVAPTRQAVVMVHVMVWAGGDHVVNLPRTTFLVNGAARRMQVGAKRTSLKASELNCVWGRL
jgi:hypothetical protein